MKRIILSFFLCGTLCGAFAQTESPSSQLLVQPRLINPSYGANLQRIEGSLLYKNQWSGFDGAPQIINFNARVPVKKLFGLGLLGNYEKSGFRKNTLIGLTADVDIRLGHESWLNFGLHLGAGMKRFDLSHAVSEVGEVIGENFDQNYFVGGYGLSWVWKNLEIGASNYISFLGEEEGEMYNVYVHGEYRLHFGNKWVLRPVVLYSYNNQWKNWVEPGVFCSYNNWLTLGVSDRIDEHVTFTVLLRIIDHLSLSYSYDVNTGNVRKLASSSHEVGLSFNLAY